ncbi:hypothetical protein BV25DRAFT_1181282 [Artomyces pyxidatus]|uniref:Uncharacterized protein n=1 Tax=Artomyces pyxidatus TaxID=48021 RepID=A0ACB8SS98_9AGAM|nr:hypothetical protein BV25DRAFT_1181282 [Artomyces pyxidatus]
MYEKANAAITRVLTEICDVVREGASNSALDADDLRDLLLKASELEHSVIDRTYRDVGEHLHDPIPVYCGNNVKDASMGSRLAMGPNAAKDLISIMISWNIQKGSGKSVDEERNNMDGMVDSCGPVLSVVNQPDEYRNEDLQSRDTQWHNSLYCFPVVEDLLTEDCYL